MKNDYEFVQHLLSRRRTLKLPDKEPVSTAVKNLSGNMNRVRRVQLFFEDNQRFSFVIKHLPENGRLERFPNVLFPSTRLKFELLWNQAYFENPSNTNVRPAKLLDHDKNCETLIFEDLGELPSIARVISSPGPHTPTIELIAKSLGAFHAKTVDFKPVVNPSAAQNRPFVLTLPLDNPELVRELWKNRRKNNLLSDNERELLLLQEWFIKTHKKTVFPHLLYMQDTFKDGCRLVFTHGDLHGESMLVLPDGGLAILDAELCDSGTPAFDVGTILAHIVAALVSSRKVDNFALHKLLTDFLDTYQFAFLQSVLLKEEEIVSIRTESIRYTGAELIRRAIGVAEFPGISSISNPKELLEFAAELICLSDISAVKKLNSMTRNRQ